MAIKKTTPFSLVWELTLRCNACCLHCGSNAGVERSNSLEYSKILQTLDEIAQLNCVCLSLIGGEYFLYPKWKELAQEIVKRKITTNIVTNGWLVTENVIDFMQSIGMSDLAISIDGGTAKTHDYIRQVPGIFDRAFKAIEIANRKNFPIVVITAVNKINIKELKKLRELLLNYHIYTWQIQHTSVFGRMKDEFSLDDFEYYITGLFIAQTRILYDNKMHILGMHCCGYYSKTIPQHVAKKYWMGCIAGHNALGIRSDGKVLGCLSLYDDKYVEGDLNEQTLTQIINKKDFCAWNKRLERFKHRTGACVDCPYAFLCLGGCTSFNHEQSPKCYYAIEDYCSKHQPQNDFDTIFKSITNGKMDKKGNFFLADGTLLTNSFIDGLNISDRHKEVLKLIVLD